MKYIAFFCGVFILRAAVASADLYQWTDDRGVTHVIDNAGAIPEAYREKIKTYRAPKPTTTPTSLLAPSRQYAAKSQGAFAQKLALDLGLIKNTREDALGPLGTAGIQPAGGWRVDDPLSSDAHGEVLAAARRAAESQRVKLSADGAEAVARQAANDFLPPPPPPEAYEEEYDQEPEVIVEQQPPQVIEVIREPVYIPQPVIVGDSWWQGGHPGGVPHRPDRNPPRESSRRQSQFSTPAPTHIPFGASHMPFGASHMPFGSASSRGARK
jgi:hypothetical protein